MSVGAGAGEEEVHRRVGTDFVLAASTSQQEREVAKGVFLSSRRRHTRCSRDWSSDVCSSDLTTKTHTQTLDQFRRGIGLCFCGVEKIRFDLRERQYQIGRASCRERV